MQSAVGNDSKHWLNIFTVLGKSVLTGEGENFISLPEPWLLPGQVDKINSSI